MSKNIYTTNKSFFLRLIAFFFLFVLATGITGSYVVGSRLLYDFSFFIYGNLGKLVLFSCLALFLLLRNKKLVLQPIKSSWRYGLYILAGFLLIPIFFIESRQLLEYQSFSSNIPLSLGLHTILVSIPVLFAFGIFTPSFLWSFTQKYWKLIGIGLISGAFYDVSIFYIWKLWPFFSNIVLSVINWVFSLTQHPVYIIPPRTLFVRNFAITIAEACSGIDSMYLLLTLYLLIIGIDWKVLNKKKVVIFFIPLFIGMFIVNIIRVYLLIYIGLVFSPKITFELFHTYLGLVLFMLYFLAFLYFVYPKMRIRKKLEK